ncbi:DUF4280 domain-containing protein [Aneurinibacillus thermoaerophilus]|uniref:DUF4280 domain-containing protein n=1 Tax=Aneurinibacillus thermoaerophilus TaxID=143495 RepID=UPI002E1EC001
MYYALFMALEEQQSYVVAGATLCCSMGSEKSKLQLPVSHGLYIKDKPQMNVMDYQPYVNIMPFGMCSKGGMCIPNITMPWMNGKSDKMVGGFPALSTKSTVMCIAGGNISIEDDGQEIGSGENEEESFWDGVADFFSPVTEFVKGAGAATVADLSLGVLEKESHSKHPVAYQCGEVVGHGVATVVGALEIGVAVVGGGGGVIVSGTGVGASVGAPAIAGAGAVGAHGTGVMATGSSNLVQSGKDLYALISNKNKPIHSGKGTPKATQGTGKYQVGAYKDIKGVGGLDAHHVGQKALMKKLVDNYDLNTAPAINVPKIGHTIKGPNGIVSRSTKGIDNPRQLLARDIMELRRVYDDIPNSVLKELIELNKNMYPEMRRR